MGRIGIRAEKGLAVLYNKGTGKRFYPRGFDYIRARFDYHSTFAATSSEGAGDYEPYTAESMFRTLAHYGYNSVRVFVCGRSPTPNPAGDPDTQGVYAPYLDNLADFLARAAKYGIYTIFNFGDGYLPDNRYFQTRTDGNISPNTAILTRRGLEGKMEYIGSTLNYLKLKNPGLLKAILGVEFDNEVAYSLDKWPFNEAGKVTTANGKSYDMSDLADRTACGEDGCAFITKHSIGW